MKFTSKSDKETQKFASDLAKSVKGGEVFGLIGNLGAGKTTFTQGFAKGLGVKQKITSPTFVLMKVYRVEHPAIKHFCHIDAYRIMSLGDLEAIGALDYLGHEDCISIIEWADRINLPTMKVIKLEHSDQERIIYY